ncbi:MAG: T9SS type A sorting domain-containing protein [bacterium]
MRVFVTILFFFLITNLSEAEWTQRFFAESNRTWIQSGDVLYMGLVNGLSTYNFSTQEKQYYNSLTSDLPGNYINSITPLHDGSLLVSTNRGLAQIINGTITNDNPICKNYPDTDARNLYIDSSENIWTFSEHKVHRWNGQDWFTFNIEDSITFRFEIMRLNIHQNQVWVQFNDRTKTKTTYYWNEVSDEYIKIAVIEGDSISKLFQTIEEFPYRQGTPKLASIGSNIILKNYNGVYIYQDSVWSLTNMLDVDSIMKPNYYSDFFVDMDGNLWYYVGNNSAFRPTSYNISTGEVTEHLKWENDAFITKINVMNNGQVVAFSTTMLYFKNDTGWVKVSAEDVGIPVGTNFYYPNIYNNQIYIWFTTTKDSILRGTLYCIEDSSMITPYTEKNFYTNLTQFAINKNGKGMFKGRKEALTYEADSAFVRPNLISNSGKMKSANDGNVYFNYLRIDNTLISPNLTTWEGNDLININMGFSDSLNANIRDFDFSENYFYALGDYETGPDSLNSYLSIYYTDTKELKTYDKYNSCMPDYYYERVGGFLLYPRDTVTYALSVENDETVWISTKESLIRFAPEDCQIFDLPEGKPALTQIYYDLGSDEIINKTWNNYLYIFDVGTETWDSLDISVNVFNGNLILFKKLLDNRIWASDNLGYMYRYEGNGKFLPFNLKIYGKDHLDFPINDFCIDANLWLHLGTDIGLLSNNDILLSVEEELKNVNEILISPNPALDYINIQLPINISNIENQETEIYNVMGQKLISTKNIGKVGIGELSAGVYIIRYGNLTSKFIKIY